MSRPTVDDTPAEVEAIMRTLPARFRPDRVPEFAGHFHFEIAGAEKPAWTVIIDGGECRVEEGLLGEPACVVRMSEKTYVGIETGKKNPMIAFVKGRIKVTSVGHMRRYDRAFWKLYDK
jgi:putative sterol carrier protein